MSPASNPTTTAATTKNGPQCLHAARARVRATIRFLAGDDDSAKMPALLRASGVALADLRGDVDKEDDTVVPKLIEKLGLRGVQ